MAMERDPHRHARAQQRPQPVELRAQEQDERRHLERLGAARALDRRQGELGELHEAARAPGQHLSALALGELVHRAFAEAARCFDITGPRLHHAAAVRGASHDVIAHVDRVHDVEGKERNVRRLEHVAAGVEHDVGRLGGRPVDGSLTRILAEARKLRIGKLHLGEMRDVARDQAEALDAGLALLARLVLRARHRDARHVEQKARIDAVVADLDALAREHAGARPFA
jgi:hypothetical protein